MWRDLLFPGSQLRPSNIQRPIESPNVLNRLPRSLAHMDLRAMTSQPVRSTELLRCASQCNPNQYNLLVHSRSNPSATDIPLLLPMDLYPTFFHALQTWPQSHDKSPSDPLQMSILSHSHLREASWDISTTVRTSRNHLMACPYYSPPLQVLRQL